MRRSSIIVTLLGCFLLCGCHALERKHQVGAVAEVHGQYVYRSTLDSLTLGLSPEDSARVAQQYISQWAKDILMYEGAMSNVHNAEIERLVADYRRTLYVHAYEEYLVDKRMPKDINDSTIAQYYNLLSDRFQLNESIMKGLLVIVPVDAPKIKDLRKWLTQVPAVLPSDESEEGAPNESNEVMDNIEKYVYQNASGYELFTDKWRTTSELLAQLPIERADLENQLKSKNQIELSDSLKTYILQITEKHKRGEAMPIDYARPDIEKIILTTRQVDFLQAERERIYEEAVEEQKVIFY
ncbi:MAG: hypothetical protein IJS82_00785 [Paludibacteraceae bacterium]|nr:hypothetical protein [Paludibacteraceae bacterium]